MSWTTSKRRWAVRAVWGSLAGLFVPLLFLVIGAQPVSALVTCSFSASTLTVTLASGDSATISRTADGTFSVVGSGYGGDPDCVPGPGAATVTNVARVVIEGDDGPQTVTIDQSNGPFEPGAGVAEAGTSEIEFDVNLGDLLTDDGDSLTILGQPVADTIVVGSEGVNLNGDDDVDVGSDCTLPDGECAGGPIGVDQLTIDGA